MNPWKLSEAQRALLTEVRQREVTGIQPEWFAPNMAVVRALKRRNLVATRFIGQRCWTIQLTKAGRRWLRTADPNHQHPGRDADGEPGNVSE